MSELSAGHLELIRILARQAAREYLDGEVAPAAACEKSRLFLDVDELRTLTGYSAKAQQIAALKTMGIAFYVNAAGRPVVVRAVIEGRRAESLRPSTPWEPRASSVSSPSK